MKFIAHRGLYQGPDPSRENHPDQINRALAQGYDCEVDLWCLNDQLWLGHDRATYEISRDFIGKPGLWIHAKNFEALNWLTKHAQKSSYFWHEHDQYTLTSSGHIWSYPGMSQSQNSIQLMPEWDDPELNNIDLNCFGVCSDFVELIRSKI